jgi:hypothetical protein
MVAEEVPPRLAWQNPAVKGTGAVRHMAIAAPTKGATTPLTARRTHSPTSWRGRAWRLLELAEDQRDPMIRPSWRHGLLIEQSPPLRQYESEAGLTH